MNVRRVKRLNYLVPIILLLVKNVIQVKLRMLVQLFVLLVALANIKIHMAVQLVFHVSRENLNQQKVQYYVTIVK